MWSRGTDVQLYIGQADYKIAANADTNWNDPREMTDHLAFAARLQRVRARALQRRAGAGQQAGRHRHLRGRALRPPGAGADHDPPAGQAAAVPGGHVGHPRRGGGGHLRWRQPADGVGPFGKATSYAIYRFDGTRLPGACATSADATHLIGTVRARAATVLCGHHGASPASATPTW